jgi:C-terminal binding protein
MVKTVLYAEKLYDNDKAEREVFGSDVRVVWRNVDNLSQLEERDCADVDGLMVLRHGVTAEHFAKFPKLACVVRMGVGYDKIDRKAAAARKVMVCNVPDYGTTEVADHALALVLSLRRGIALHLEAQRRPQPAPWRYVSDPLLRRSGVQTFGIVGLGRIGTAAALRAKAFQFRVVAYDPYMPNGTELGVGVERVNSLEALMEQTDTLSVHAPLTLETRGMISRAMLERMPKGGVVVSTARGPICDVDALADLLKRGHLGRARPQASARLPRARTVVRGAPDHHAALRLLHARGVGRHPAQVGGDHARGDGRAAAAERHHAGHVLTAGPLQTPRLLR